MFRQHLAGGQRRNVGSGRWTLLVFLLSVKLQTGLEPCFYLAKTGHLLALINIPLMWKQSLM